MVNQDLLVKFLRVYAFQPATAFWRSVEVDVLRAYIPTSGNCLDLGCGDGKLTSILMEKIPPSGLKLVGIDGDPDETQHAKQSPLYSRVHTCLASKIPEPSGSFDAVISNSVLEHIQDIDDTIAEVARLLRKDGVFVFTVPATGFHDCLHGPLKRSASRETYLQEMDIRLAHYRYWDAAQWQEHLSPYGLRIEKQAEYFNRGEVRRWETISRYTAGILYALNRRKRTPIGIQKSMGLRQAQNRLILPLWLARLMALFLSFRLDPSEEQNSCLLISARKLEN